MRIIFEFAGGPMDGKTVIGQLGEQDEADRYYALTHHGRIGQRFRVASSFAIEMLAKEVLQEDRPYHFQQHSYRVSDRLEGDDEVLVRVEYVGKEGDKLTRRSTWTGQTPSTPDPAEPLEATIGRFVVETVQALSRSYSHYWPAAETTSRDLSLHLAHVLLSKDFSLLASAAHPQPDTAPIDLLALAPGQDLFLACQLELLHEVAQLELLAGRLDQLRSFWLHPGLTIEACRQHIVRVARHCQRGVGLVCALHDVPQPAESSTLLDLWTTCAKGGQVPGQFTDTLVAFDAHWLEPRLVRRFDGQVSFYLLAAFFPIAQPAGQ